MRYPLRGQKNARELLEVLLHFNEQWAMFASDSHISKIGLFLPSKEVDMEPSHWHQGTLIHPSPFFIHTDFVPYSMFTHDSHVSNIWVPFREPFHWHGAFSSNHALDPCSFIHIHFGPYSMCMYDSNLPEHIPLSAKFKRLEGNVLIGGQRRNRSSINALDPPLHSFIHPDFVRTLTTLIFQTSAGAL